MHQRKYFTSNFFINEVFSVEKFPKYGMHKVLSLHVLLEYKYGLVHKITQSCIIYPLITWAVLLGSMDQICICNDYKFNCFRLTRNNIM